MRAQFHQQFKQPNWPKQPHHRHNASEESPGKSKVKRADIQQLLNKDFVIMDEGTENNVDV